MQRWRSLVETAKHQIYISRSRDPFLNLSIEHFLLQNSKPYSTVLFLYINTPCIVIGRNQNPWLEANLGLLNSDVQLVRRRSGGGTVFHDEGNVNYSVICSPADFTRAKHVEMVTKAIRTFNDRVRVNERHDIVLDGGPLLLPSQMPSKDDMHRTNYTASLSPLKISGSAYKIIRNRCLHHGTCLVASPNLSMIGSYLKSPARPFIKGRGVESVPSPVGNLSSTGTGNKMDAEGQAIVSDTDKLQARVVSTFADMYDVDEQYVRQNLSKNISTPSIWSRDGFALGFVGTEALEVKDISKGVEELKSPKWIYGQTPQFTLSSHAFGEDDRERPSIETDLPQSARVYLKARGGTITETNISLSNHVHSFTKQKLFDDALTGKDITEIESFINLPFDMSKTLRSAEVLKVMAWLNKMFAK